MRCAPLLRLAGSILLASTATVGAELYQWVDAEGVVRYTPSRRAPPLAHRDSLQEVRPGMAMPALPPQPNRVPEPDAGTTFPSVIGAPVPDPSPSLGDTGLPAPGPTAIADAVPSDEPSPGDEPSAEPDLATRIRELEQAIARDEETLKDMISTPPAEGEEGIESSAELREIARRLPGMQAELRALKQRQAVEGP